MRTFLILLGGLVLYAAMLGGFRAASLSAWHATLAFIAIWFGLAAANMWVGVTEAGYSVREELPIFLVIFLIPTVIALLVRSKIQ
jgi:uncharacterized membrane protein YwaF